MLKSTKYAFKIKAFNDHGDVAYMYIYISMCDRRSLLHTVTRELSESEREDDSVIYL